MNAPVLDLGKGDTEAHQFVLDKEGYHLRQSYLFFLAIGEAGHRLALYERLAVRGLDMAQCAGRVADQREGFAGGQEGFYQLDRVLVFGEIPHRPMTTGVEDGIVVVRLDAVETKCCRELRFRVRIGFEPMRKVGLKVRLVALRIEGRLVALRRGEHNLGAGFFESVVRGGELFEPEARLAAGVAELVVRGQNHQDFHELLLYRGSDKTTTPHSPLLGLE